MPGVAVEKRGDVIRATLENPVKSREVAIF